MWRSHAALEVLELGIWSRLAYEIFGGRHSYRAGFEDFVVLVADKPVTERVPPPKPKRAPGAAKWITAEIKRMKQDGKIPDDIGITVLAKALADRMLTAAATDPSLRPVKAPYIKNNLASWGLWPVFGIK